MTSKHVYVFEYYDDGTRKEIKVFESKEMARKYAQAKFVPMFTQMDDRYTQVWFNEDKSKWTSVANVLIISKGESI